MMGVGRASLWESMRRLFTPGASDRDAGRPPHAGRAALLCLLAAIVIWFLLTMGEPHTATLPFRVVLLNPPPGEALVAPLPEEVTGRVEGDGFQILQLFFNTPRIDLRASSSSVDLMDQANTLPSSVDVLSLTPRTLSLETDELVQRRIPVDLRAVFRPATTYSFTDADSVRYTPDSVTVAGAARVVNRLRSWPSEVRSFTNLRDSIQVTIPLVDTLQGYVTVEPKEVHVRVGVAAFTEVERVVEVTISSAPSERAGGPADARRGARALQRAALAVPRSPRRRHPGLRVVRRHPAGQHQPPAAHPRAARQPPHPRCRCHARDGRLLHRAGWAAVMGFLTLAVACSLSIGMVFKWAALRHLDRLRLLTVNYGTGAVLALLLWMAGEARGAMSLPLLGLGLFTGALFIGGFFLLSLATERAGMGLALGVMRLSVVVPVAVSWSVWREVPTPLQQAGLVVACAALLLLAWPARAGRTVGHRAGYVLMGLFAVGGVADVLLKTFDEQFSAHVPDAAYLALVFATACIIGCAGLLRRAAPESRAESRVYVAGAALGVVNYGSAVFLLEAVARMRGTVVFPLNNIAIVVGSALLGRWVWNEPIGRRNRLGLACAVAALLLLGSGA